LRANTERRATAASIAVPNRTAMRTASALSTGSTPGMPRSISQAWVLGPAPNAVAAPEKIFERVASWAWISSPITVSHSIASDLDRYARDMFRSRRGPRSYR